MLAKVPDKRNDGKSSFKSLQRYMEARDVIDPETGEVTGWEPDGVAAETNCISRETAWREMLAVADMNGRIGDPVYHVVLSWPSQENPTDEQAFEACREAMKAVGMEGHQYVAAVHRDTDNAHVHLMVNRVHPETYKAVYPDRDYFKLDKCMREMELRQGWSHDKGPHAVHERDGKKVVGWAKESPEEYRREQREKGPKLPGKARQMETMTGNESLASYAQGQPKNDALAAIQKPGAAWEDLHRTLARHGLKMEPVTAKATAFRIYSATDPNQTPIKASTMAQELGGGRLIKALGPYQAHRPEMAQEPAMLAYSSQRPKRDPAVREDRREARAAERADLRDRYRAFRDDWNASKAPTRADMYERQQRRRRELAAAAKTERDSIRKSSLPMEEKRARYSLAAMGAAAARKELADEIKAERAQFRAERPQDYRAWVADRAQEGDLSAIRQVRGWAYQDRRTARAMERADTAAERGPHLASSDGQAHDPAAPRRMSERVSWTVDRTTGAVDYKLDGREAFRDSGRRIDYTEGGQHDTDAIEAGLLLAREKFGGTALNITGPDEFRQRVVAVAIAKGLDVRFSDPELEQQRIEGQREHQEARTRPDWSRFRQSAVVSEERPTEPSQPAPGQQTHARAKREEEARKLAERQKQQAAGKRPDWTRFRSSSVVSDDRGAEPVQAAPPRDVPTPEPQRDDARARREAEARALAEKQRQQDTEREQEHSRDDDNSPEMP